MKPTNTSVDVRQMAFDLTFEQEAPHGAILKPESIVIVTLPRVVMDDPLPAPEKVKSVFDLFDIPPLSVAFELGVQSQRQEIGHEETIHRRTDHWLPAGS